MAYYSTIRSNISIADGFGNKPLGLTVGTPITSIPANTFIYDKSQDCFIKNGMADNDATFIIAFDETKHFLGLYKYVVNIKQWMRVTEITDLIN